MPIDIELSKPTRRGTINRSRSLELMKLLERCPEHLFSIDAREMAPLR